MISAIDTYRAFADLYDLYVGKFDEDVIFYTASCEKTDIVVEIGCGTGRILAKLLPLGYRMTGVDISPEMLINATKKLKPWIDSGKVSLMNHDFSTASLNLRFDKALLTFYTFNYIIDNPIGFLSNIYKCLTNDGLLLMDLLYPRSLFNKSIDGKWTKKEYSLDGDLVTILDKRIMAGDWEKRQQVFIIGGTEVQIESLRKYYRPAYVGEILQRAGFSSVEFSYGYDYTGFQDAIDEINLKRNYIVKAKK